MDEILASIRRIIESSDEKPGAFVASNAARAAAAGRAGAGREVASDRPAAVDLPVPAARVVPFSERAPFSPQPQAAFAESEERWVPLTAPANQPDRPASAEAPSVAAEAASAQAEPVHVEPVHVEPVAAVAASDRWTQEFDDVESWSVLEEPPEPAAHLMEAPVVEASAPDVQSDAEAELEVRGDSLEAPADPAIGTAAETSAPEAVTEVEPQAELRIVEPVEPEAEVTAQAPAGAVADDLLEGPASIAAESQETEPPEAAVESDDDFPLDFNEADFVEALDRNTAVLAAAAAAESPAAPAREAERGFEAGFAEAAVARPFLRQRSPAEERAAIFPAAASAAEPPAPAPAPSVIQEASALMSDQAGAEVAAAFDDLARAIRDGQMKSMEEMAREMLRPMLQEWLDDNLPRLVERLVRDEIERVSRGARG